MARFPYLFFRMIPVADKLKDIRPFVVMEVLARADALRRAGHPVIGMEVGEPDFATPQPILDAAGRALAGGATRYTSATGLPELRRAIAGFYASDYGLSISPSRIVVTAGGSGALLLASALLTNPGDEWLMTDPGYPCNRNFVTAFGGEPRGLPVDASTHFQLTAERVSSEWRENTRAVLLASPANPTGTEVTKAELAAIAAEVRARQGVLVVDEIYHGLSYDSDVRESALAVDDDVIVINSFSKYFCMTGWRLGWMVVPESTVPLVEKLAQNLFICPSTVAQHAALACFTAETRAITESYRESFRERRDFLVPALSQCGFDIPAKPSGAFYVYAGIPEGQGDAPGFCRRLLEEHHVAVTPGADFGDHLADRYVRFSYAQGMPALTEAIDRMMVALANGTGP